jgi:hypothetical protein
MGLEQAFPNAITLGEDAWPTIEHLVLQTIRTNVILHGVVLCPGLQPERGDVQLLCLLEQAKRHLSPQSQEKGRGMQWQN